MNAIPSTEPHGAIGSGLDIEYTHVVGNIEIVCNVIRIDGFLVRGNAIKNRGDDAVHMRKHM